MQNLRDQLLKAGLVTEEQVTKAEAQARPRPKKKPKKPRSAPTRREVAAQPVNRMVDTSDPVRLEILQAVEEHRVRGNTRGDVEFYFSLRDGRVRKLFVSPQISGGLASGRLAIVENGAPDTHIIVSSEAVAAIRAADANAVRFFNAH